MSSWTHLATGILLVAPAIAATLLIAARSTGSVKPAYPVVAARRSMRSASVSNPVPAFICASRGLSR